ncbi:MAG: divergent polysaccharide deacetylase family protein [Desulfarculaceae bacterium]|nr:divergent polysaccharide deacetylase family protein [Desulfarculaceae bacterium]
MSKRPTKADRRRAKRRLYWGLGAAAVALAFAIGLWWGGGTPTRPRAKAVVKHVAKAKPTPKPKAKAKPAPAKQPAPAPAEPQRPALPRVALIIDDMGHGTQPLNRLLALRIPLTVSVLPHAPQAQAVARRARQAGLGVMLHLPMEPVNYAAMPKGTGLLMTNMSRPEVLAVLSMDLARVPQAQGVNNHMGSLYSRSAARMEPVLIELKKRGLFYVDSFTAADSQGLATAQRLGLVTARRDVFLDHSSNPTDIDAQFQRLIKLAQKRGAAIAIGHPQANTIAALERWKPRLHKKVQLVLAKELVKKGS